MTVGKLLKLPVPQFLDLYIMVNNSVYLAEFLQGLREMMLYLVSFLLCIKKK